MIFKKIQNNKTSGYITLMLMLVIAAVSFMLIFSALRSSVNSSKSILVIKQEVNARSYANTCIENALYQIKLDPSSASGTVEEIISDGSCSYTTTTPDATLNPSVWNILSIGILGDVSVQINTNTILTDSNLEIIDWNEESNASSFILAYTAGVNGTLSETTPQTVHYGDDGAEVEAIPDANYYFVNWSDGLTSNPRIDENVTRNISVTANFANNVYDLNYTTNGSNGTLLGNTAQRVNYNGSGTPVTAVPVDGYHFVDWDDDLTANPRTDINVTDIISVIANFEIDSE